MDTLREKIARTFCHESPNCKRQCSGNCAGIKEFIDTFLALIRAEVEKVENPYQDKLGMIIESDGFEACRQAVLKALRE